MVTERMRTPQERLGSQICEALGIDPGIVHSVTLHPLKASDFKEAGLVKLTLEVYDFEGKLEEVDWSETLSDAEIETEVM